MSIDNRALGLRRYVYEYYFYRAIEKTKELQAPEKGGSVIMVSRAKKLREIFGEKLEAQGVDLDDPNQGFTPILGAIEDTMSENVADYQPLFGDLSKNSSGYQVMTRELLAMVGNAKPTAQNQNPTGPAGPRLPVSPYDPRFSQRSTVKAAGSSLLVVPDEVITQVAGSVAKVDSTYTEDMVLYTEDPDKGGLVEAGRAMSLDDISGMTELMGYMSEGDYKEVRDWVIAGARTEEGGMDASAFMSRDALARSAAILEELGSQGLDYKVVRDENPGQIKAVVEGTRINVRLTDTRKNENFVGRVYDNGAYASFTTSHWLADEGKNMAYTPSAEESVQLLRLFQGKPVERTDGKGLVGQPGSHEGMVRKSNRTVRGEVNDSYLSGANTMSVFGDLMVNGRAPSPNAKVIVNKNAENRSETSRFFKSDSPEAEIYLSEAVETARENFAEALDVDRVMAEAEEHGEAYLEGAYAPVLSADQNVAAIQRSYWDVLTGVDKTLLRPGMTREEYEERVGMVGEDVEQALVALEYEGENAQDIVRQHAADVVDATIGQYQPAPLPDDPEAAPRRFDPVHVAQYMTSSYGTWRNNDDIVAALRAEEIDPDELIGSNFYNATIKDKMIRFDEESARSVDEVEDPFLAKMLTTTHDSLDRGGVIDPEVRIDDQGVISWSGTRKVRQNAEAEAVEISGEIGQIFAPGDHGAIITRFAGSENYLFVPGYDARITPQTAGESKSVEERTMLRGYEQVMTDSIQYQISNDLMSGRTAVGAPAGLNGTYRRLTDVRHEVDFVERSAEEGLSEDWRNAILETEARRVRYSNAVRDGSTINEEYRASRAYSPRDAANDNTFDPYVLTGGRNMSILTQEANGYFDPMVTSGSINQGITRYLVEGAEVDENGRIAPGAEDDRTPLMKHPDAASMRFNPFDRQQMTASNLMNAAAVTPPVGTAMMTFGGWTADDPMVISERFAGEHQIRGADGELRDLVVGDKLSDLHGNKGVISLIIDPENKREAEIALSEAQTPAERSSADNMLRAHEVFSSNPDLDVVMSPFSAVSRYNGGSARELMEDSEDLLVPGQGPKQGGLGHMRFIVTHMAVDSKTRIYDDEDLSAGRGRKASSQLAWAMGAQGCSKIMAEAYGSNNAASENFREMMVTMGMDMEPDGTLRVGQDDMQEGNERRLFEMRELALTSSGALNRAKMKREFGELIGDKGGDLEMPFPLQFPSQEKTPKATDSSWRLPVMSSHLRSGQDLEDGSSTAHDYTNQYLAIYDQACQYRMAQQRLEANEFPDGAKGTRARDTQERIVRTAPARAQSSFNLITENLKARKFSGKHNVFKESLMSNRLSHSATAVWTSDPRLDIDQVSMGPGMAESLGVEKDDSVLIWRDPMLRDAGVRYMKVDIDDRLTGVAINPVMDKCFDGDFDGDSVAVVKLNTKAAQREAEEKLSVPANLLDFGTKDENGFYPLSMQDSLDTKVSQHFRPELKERFEELTMRANDVHMDREEGSITDAEALTSNRALSTELSDYYREVLSPQYGEATLSFSDAQSHLESVKEACIDTGAKGSMSKLELYTDYLGCQIDDEGVVHDRGEPLTTRKDQEGVMYATAVKSFGTGVAGKFSQRGVKALRNEALKPVLELTYPVTQSILQSKHDPEEARTKYENLMGPARQLWRGRQLEKGVDNHGKTVWNVARDEKKREIQADPETWKAQFVDLYSSKEGLNVPFNMDNVEAVAEALTDAHTGKMADIEDVQYEWGATMDRLAYDGTFDDVLAAARERQNIFAGEQNGHFAPLVVQGNQQAIADFETEIEEKGFTADVEAPELVALTKKDTRVDGAARGSNRRSRNAVVIKGAAREESALVTKRLVNEVESSDGPDSGGPSL